MTKLINGRALAREITKTTRTQLNKLHGTPGLAIVLVGTNSASEVYVKVKEKACRSLGIKFELHRLSSNTFENEIIDRVKTLSVRPDIHGIVIQLPLPRHLNQDRIIQAIDWRKDVDGFHPTNLNNLLAGKPIEPPSLIKGLLYIIKKTRVGLKNKQVAILANADAFTKPLEYYLVKKGAQVAIVKTGLPHRPITEAADLIIIAYGQPGFIKGRDIKEGAVIIDMGITRQSDGTISGDVDADSINGIASQYTPVPGGVGPVTVATLLDSTVRAFQFLTKQT
ncbi:MAG: bifunctional 5,10-methylenetetrahydrofolate dehydrogenase/5,10-methenyltetrahydrofolate cyclohydrolase [bacterium]